MPHFKNTPITGLNELVIDGRTKKIQWKKYNKEWWWRNNFERDSPYPELDRAISCYPNEYNVQVFHVPSGTTLLEVIQILPHSEIMKRMHNYDDHPEKFDTWTSGFTFNVKVLPKPKKEDKSKELLEKLYAFLRGETSDEFESTDYRTSINELLKLKEKYGLDYE